MNGRAVDINQSSINTVKPERLQQTIQNNVPVPKKIVAITAVTATPTVHPVQEINPIDLQSRLGRFGWPEASTDVYYGIPYILRDSMKYFAVQMIITKSLIRTYLSCLHQDVYNYYFRVLKHATPAECYLMNEINIRHCNYMFGQTLFTIESLTLIRDTDAYELWEFLDTCYRKLTSCMKVVSDKIGFIQFNFTGVYIPYVMRNNDRYMPLYCFSDINNVPVDYISGWELAYLRFCCLYQGIWKGSYDIFPVVKLSSMYAYLPVDTHFLTCWPLLDDHQLMRSPAPVPVITFGKGLNQATGSRNQIGTVRRRLTMAVDTRPKICQNDTKKRCGETIADNPPTKIRRCDRMTISASNRKVQGIADKSQKVGGK